MYNQEGKGFFTKKKLIGLIVVIVVIVSVVVAFGNATVTIPTGYKGVLLVWGEATQVLPEGLHFINPIGTDVELMNVQIQKAEATEATASEDLQEVTTTVAVNYRLEEAYLLEIYKNFRQDYESRIIAPNIEESLKAATAEYAATELITNREEVKTTFLNILESRVDDFHIEILSVSVTNFQFSPSFTAAIEAKVTAEQKALEAQNKLKQIEYEAQQQVIQASANATATITIAQAQANATVITANATAEAIQTIQVQLTPEYVQYLVAIGWDGKLPLYWSGNGTMPLLLIPTETPTENP
ncbi:MAG TPA: prohibitin family protein [Candidatus Bathyarchaeia archaeon]|nr:prohibitin family protein [Candidatus Bathyarchaeia archaeon]